MELTVQTAVARGDLTQKVVGVKVSGEILDLVNTINNMIDQLAIFAAEVTRVAREVGTEGKLGVQAEVGNIEGTWQEITYVKTLAGCMAAIPTDCWQVQCQHDGVQPYDSSTRLCTNFGGRHRWRLYKVHHRLGVWRDGLAQDQDQPDGLQSPREYRKEHGRQAASRDRQSKQVGVPGQHVA